MKIYLPEARQNQDQVSSYFYEGKIPDSFGIDSSQQGQLQVKADIRISGDKVFLEGTLNADFTAVCSRCLKVFTRHLDVDFNETFNLYEGIPPKESPAELALKAANELTIYGDNFYLDEYLRQVFLLAQGYRSLCRDDCQGICPMCGADLNQGRCGCVRDEEIDPRLKVLKDFFPGS
ncbi:MAG TPA: hypothetical protein GX693_01485 [Firmicutes bacterium]|nr:hypothetical protein [Bacillota bacterium]